jgi:hypothetical protein
LLDEWIGLDALGVGLGWVGCLENAFGLDWIGAFLPLISFGLVLMDMDLNPVPGIGMVRRSPDLTAGEPFFFFGERTSISVGSQLRETGKQRKTQGTADAHMGS